MLIFFVIGPFEEIHNLIFAWKHRQQIKALRRQLRKMGGLKMFKLSLKLDKYGPYMDKSDYSILDT